MQLQKSNAGENEKLIIEFMWPNTVDKPKLKWCPKSDCQMASFASFMELIYIRQCYCGFVLCEI